MSYIGIWRRGDLLWECWANDTHATCRTLDGKITLHTQIHLFRRYSRPVSKCWTWLEGDWIVETDHAIIVTYLKK